MRILIGFKRVVAAAVFAAIGMTAVAANKPPAEYQAVEYIESSGSQFINTKIVPKANTRVVLDFALLAIPTANNYCGWGSQANAEAFLFGAKATCFYFNISPDWRTEVLTDVAPDLERHVMDAASGSQKLDGKEYGTTSIGSTASADQYIHLFASRVEWATVDYWMKAKVYGCQIFEGEKMVRDFVPCYKVADGTIGLYDTVSEAFFGNSGSSAFTKGPDRNYEDRLEIVGSPANYGEVSPAYGVTNALAANDSFTCSAPAQVEDGEVHALCSGCQLYKDVDGEWVAWGDPQTGNTFTYTHPEGCAAKLEWLWEVRKPAGLDNVAVKSSAPGRLSVSANAAGVGYQDGDTLAVKVAWGRDAANLLYTNDVGTATKCDDAVSATITAKVVPGVNHYARVFALDQDGAVAWEGETVEVYVLSEADQAPAGYTFFTYLKSNGSASLDTGYQPGNTTKVEMHYGQVTYESQRAFFGQGWSGSRYLFNMQSDKYMFHGGGNLNFSLKPAANTDYCVTVAPTGSGNGGTLTLVDETNGNTYTSSVDLSVDGNSKLKVFGCGGNYAKFALYSMKIWKADELVRWYVPAFSDAEQANGLYDVVTKSFLKAPAAFTVGDELPALIGGGETTPNAVLTVGAIPEELGAADLAYGEYGGIPAGQTFECFAPAGFTNETKRAICTGWKLYATNSTDTTDWVVIAQGTGNVCSYTHPAGSAAKLVWEFQSDYLVDVAVDGAGTVKIADGEAAAEVSAWLRSGETYVITPLPVESGNFMSWGGDVPPAQLTQNPLSLTVTGPAEIVCRMSAGALVTWKGGAGDALASNPANWANGECPKDGETVILDASSAEYPMTWDAKMTNVVIGGWQQLEGYTNVVTFETTYDTFSKVFTNVVIGGSVRIEDGVWTHKDNFYTGNDAKLKKDKYRLAMTINGNLEVARNATTGAFGQIDVHGRGYNYNAGYSAGDRGGSYGGSTADNPGKCYGSIKNPTASGSGGWYGNQRVCNGGGAVYLDVAGDIVVDGAINADGTAIDIWTGAVDSHKGSGGSVILKAKSSISGTGLVSARAGQGGYGHSSGGGGRMAFYLTDPAATHAGFTVPVSVRQSTVNLNAAGGTIYYEVPGDAKRGHLYVESGSGDADTDYGTRLLVSQQVELDEGFSKITLAPKAIFGVNEGVTLDISNTELVIDPTSRILVWGTIVTPATYTWTGPARIDIKGAGANIFASEETTINAPLQFRTGTQFDLVGDLVVGPLGVISHAANAAYAVNLSIDGDLTIQEGGKIDVISYGRNGDTAKGYPKSSSNSGASYGGRGAMRDSDYTSDCWGSIYAPAGHGANNGGGYGAGAVKLTVAGTTRIDGGIWATGYAHDWHGGSGGSIWLTTGSLVGSGNIAANGGVAWNTYAAGGGGRIAVTLTEEGATFDDFAGKIIAFGLYNGRHETEYLTAPQSGGTRGGAGTIYLREPGEAADEGTLIVDQFRNDKKTYAKAYTEITATMPDKDFGEILVRNEGILRIFDGAEITCSVFSNASKVICEPLSKVTLVGDRDGNAYVYGSTEIPNLAIDASVKNIYFEAGTTQTVASTFSAVGADSGHRIKLRSTQDGVPFALNVSPSAIQTLDYLDVADSDASAGAKLVAQHSAVDTASQNWECLDIEPGEMIIWNGSVDTGWGNGDNWTTAGGKHRAPVATDHIVIATAQNQPVLPQTDVTVSNLTMNAGTHLTLNGYKLTVEGAAILRGALEISTDETVTFKGAVNWQGGAFIARNGKIVIANDNEGAAVNLGGLSFPTLDFANTAPLTLAGTFTATTLTIGEGCEIDFANGASPVATAFYANGTTANPIVFAPAVNGADYDFTVKGYAEVTGVNVTGADSSAGVPIYATESIDGGDNENWFFTDTRKVWTGAKNTTFADAGNWQNGEVAETGDDVVVAANASRALTVNAETGVVIRNLTLLGGTAQFTGSAEVSGTVVLVGGTMVVDQPIEIGGSLLVFDGATITHTAQGARNTELYWCDLTVAGDVMIAEGGKVDTTGKGFNCKWGPGTTRNEGGGSYGGQGHPNVEGGDYGKGFGKCYGSIFWPTNSGSGGNQGGSAGGAFVLKTPGTLTLNGTINCSGHQTSYCDRDGASGGGVALKVGRIVGSGAILANGEKQNGNVYSAGGGRIAIILTGAGADFSAFSGKVECRGTPNNNGSGWGGGAGTIYRQLPTEAFGYGEITVDSGLPDGWNTKSLTFIASACKGTANTTNMLDNLKHARFNLKDYARIVFETDDPANPVKIGDFTLDATTPSTAYIRLGLNDGDTRLKVSSQYHTYDTSKVKKGGVLGTWHGRNNPNWSSIEWQATGFMMIVR